jgi:hypothetical protein
MLLLMWRRVKVASDDSYEATGTQYKGTALPCQPASAISRGVAAQS